MVLAGLAVIVGILLAILGYKLFMEKRKTFQVNSHVSMEVQGTQPDPVYEDIDRITVKTSEHIQLQENAAYGFLTERKL